METMEPEILCMADAADVPLCREVSVVTRSRRRDIAEIALSYGLILTVIWTPRPWQRFLWLAAALIIAFLAARSFEGRREAGIRAANFLRSFWIVGVALFIASVAVLIGTRMHTLRFTGGLGLFIESYWAYALWSGVQQFLMQCFFLTRLLRVLPTTRQAVFAATGLFALAHLPNPFLTVATIVWGLAACLIFLRYRNLWTLALAHAILGITVAVTIPGPVDHNMRVGLGYLRYHRPGIGLPQRSQSDQRASTVAWVTAEAPTLRSRIHARP
jgi:hypothetical protein